MVGGQPTQSSQQTENRDTSYYSPAYHNSLPYYPPQPYSTHPQTYYSQFFPDSTPQYDQYAFSHNNYGPTTYYPTPYYSYPQKYPPQSTVYYSKPNQPTKYYNKNGNNANSRPSKFNSLNDAPQATELNKDLPSEQLPRILFPGTIIIVDGPEKVQPALAELFKDGTAMSHGIGFDMEWKPSFGKGTPRNSTSLIQLATDKVCVIFWMMYLNHQMPLELFSVLADPNIIKIGQSLDCGDNERLTQEFHLDLVNSVDISIVAKQKGFRKTNLKEQTKVLLGKNLSKFLCTSNWADVHLTPAQIRYAATDPYVTFLIYHKLKELPDSPLPQPDQLTREWKGGREGETEEDSPDALDLPPLSPEEDIGREREGKRDDVMDRMNSLSISQSPGISEPELTLSTKCPHCDRYFMKKVQVYAHLDHVHFHLLPTGDHECSVCSKVFRKYTALLIHQEMTGHNC